MDDDDVDRIKNRSTQKMFPLVKLQGCCALSGEGLTAGLDWLAARILERKATVL